MSPPTASSYSPMHSNQICDQNQVSSSLDAAMSPMSPLSPLEHHQQQQQQQVQQQAAAPQPPQNQINDMQNMVVDQMDVTMIQQQQQQQQPNLVDPMNQYRRANGTDNNDIYRNIVGSNPNYSLQSHTPDQCVEPTTVNGHAHEMQQMNDFSNGLLRSKIKAGDESSIQHHVQSPFLLPAGQNEPGLVNGYGMNLKQEPDVNF